MLRRKTIIVLAITLMVTAMVCVFSYLYVSQILRLRILNAYETANSLTQQFRQHEDRYQRRRRGAARLDRLHADRR
jgi:hypothetical protein